jgi:hypothetical protein
MAMAEFAILAMPLMLAGLFVVETARWHMARQMLSLALLEGARAGSTAHARPGAIEDAFLLALLPMFQPAGRHANARARMDAEFKSITRQSGEPPWRIRIMQPGAAAYADFSEPGLRVPTAPGVRAIRNDYQAEQHARRRGQGWVDGRGPRSGLNIFQANTLRLRLTYLHAPLVPGARTLLRWLWATSATGGASAQAGLLTIVVDIELGMHTHPADWRGKAAGSRHVGRPGD